MKAVILFTIETACEITGITASGPFGSEAFFLYPYPKQDSSPKPLEHRAALSSVGVLVGLFNLWRQTVWNQRLQLSLVIALI